MWNNQSEMPCHVSLILLFVVQKETIITHIVTNGSPSLHVTHHVLLNGRNTTIITHIVTNGSPSLHVTHHVLLNGRNTTRNNQAEMSWTKGPHHGNIIALLIGLHDAE
jgi:hypothetical protein